MYLDPPYQGVTNSADHRYLAGLGRADFEHALRAANDGGVSYIVSYDEIRADNKYGEPLDASLGLFSLFRPSKRLWQAEFLVTAFYTVVLAVCLPWTWGHPLGPLTKNLPVLATMLYLAMQETRRAK